MSQHQDQGALLGRLAIHYKLITMDQLAEATREQGRVGGRIGDILLEKGFLKPSQLEQLVAVQKDVVSRHRTAKAGDASSGETGPVATRAIPEASAASASGPAPKAVSQTKPQPAAPAPRAATAGARASAEPATPLRALRTGDADALSGILRAAAAAGASDVHLHSGARLRFRLRGRFEPKGDAPLAGPDVEAMALSMLSPEQRVLFAKTGEIDLCYTLAGVGRFRTNVYRQQRGVDVVMRLIPAEPPTLEQLGLPSSIARFTNFHQGMVLVTGPAGCGKSSTMAALVNMINEERRDHILTIEDPVEYVHVSKRCLVNQRNVRRHTESFARALRAALREDPDVIVIGELRDLETISLALTAAETGHFVLATLHTNDTIRTINRLVGAFPSDQQGQVRTMLSESLRAVVSQRLVPTADGARRVPALETLIVNKAVGNLIRENKAFQIRSILQTGASHGMGLLDDSLARLVQSGVVERAAALRFCEDPKRLGAG